MCHMAGAVWQQGAYLLEGWASAAAPALSVLLRLADGSSASMRWASTPASLALPQIFK